MPPYAFRPTITGLPVASVASIAADLRVADKGQALRNPTTAKQLREATDADALYAILAEPGVG